MQTWWWNEINEKKFKFKVWCWAKGSVEGARTSKEDCKENSCSGPAVREKEIRRKAQHRRRAEICVQDSKGKAGYGWSGNIVVKPEMIKRRWEYYGATIECRE